MDSEKIQVVVLGLSASPASNNAYALILKEVDGSRRLPIIIGAFEAQAIALEMEGVATPRPMTHDLFKSVIESLGSHLDEIYINELTDGTFYSKLYFDAFDIEIDARPSDAIALAVRFNCPIFISNEIMEEAAIAPQADDDDLAFEDENYKKSSDKGGDKFGDSNPDTQLSKMERLQKQLDKAISNEDYELAASIRDEIKNLLENS